MKKVTELLQPCSESEYPADYLMARLRGRQANFLSDWEALVMHADPMELLLDTRYGEFISGNSIEGIWKCSLKEFNWVYFQMNAHTAELFRPFFIYLELRTLLIYLRHCLRRRHGARTDDILLYSLLSDAVKKILIRGADIPSVVASLERTVPFLVLKDRKLSKVFPKEGLRGLEAKLAAALLEYIVSLELHPDIKLFFTYLIDSRNVIAVYKHLKWNISEKPDLVDGGKIRKSVLTKVLREGEVGGAVSLAGRLSGTGVREEDAVNIENILLTSLTKKVRAAARASDIGFILHYLWHTYVESRNLGIILYGRGIEKESLREELAV
jgi:hypothetical protein